MWPSSPWLENGRSWPLWVGLMLMFASLQVLAAVTAAGFAVVFSAVNLCWTRRLTVSFCRISACWFGWGWLDDIARGASASGGQVNFSRSEEKELIQEVKDLKRGRGSWCLEQRFQKGEEELISRTTISKGGGEVDISKNNFKRGRSGYLEERFQKGEEELISRTTISRWGGKVDISNNDSKGRGEVDISITIQKGEEKWISR